MFLYYGEMAMNTLWFGENLHVMRDRLKDESVDLIYLDPPFNSQTHYNVVFQAPTDRGHSAQIRAFEDTWRWGEEAAQGYDHLQLRGGAVAAAMRALYLSLDAGDEMAYLVMMALRLVEMHRLLKPTGSLFLHCDQTASFGLKWLLDHLFGRTNFRKQIIWKRSTSHGNVSRALGSLHGTILTIRRATGSPGNKYNTISMRNTSERSSPTLTATDAAGTR